MARRASRVNQLEKLERLYRKGVLTAAEYEREKHKILYGDRDENNERTIVIANPPTVPPAPPKKKQGCLGAFFKLIIVGILISIGIFFAFSSSNKGETTLQEEVGSSQENNEELKNAKNEYQKSNQHLKQALSKLSPEVRTQLKAEQTEWIRNMELACSKEEQEIAKFECLTEWTDKRFAELMTLAENTATSNQEAELDAVKQSFNTALKQMKETASALPPEVLQQLGGDGNSWAGEIETQCQTAQQSSSGDAQELAVMKCATKALKAKTKELEGYKI